MQRVGFQYKVVAAFSHMTRVDDQFIKQLIAEGENIEDLFAFAEGFESVDDQETLPVGLRKMQTLGLINPIIEIDTLRHRNKMSIGKIYEPSLQNLNTCTLIVKIGFCNYLVPCYF